MPGEANYDANGEYNPNRRPPMDNRTQPANHLSNCAFWQFAPCTCRPAPESSPPAPGLVWIQFLRGGGTNVFRTPEEVAEYSSKNSPCLPYVPAQALHIGPFYLSHGEAGQIALYKEDGEGGQFDIGKFEAHLKEFYDREF